MSKRRNIVLKILNNMSIKAKLICLYVLCIFLPLIFTDGMIVAVLSQSDHIEQRHDMEKIASATKYDFQQYINECVNLTTAIYISKYVGDLLDPQYETYYDYYLALKEYEQRLLLLSTGISNAVIYADNETIISGGSFRRMSSVQNEAWFQKFVANNQHLQLMVYYVEGGLEAAEPKRRISLVRKLDYYKIEGGCDKILRMDLDYGTLMRNLNHSQEYQVYVVADNRILFNNMANDADMMAFRELSGTEKIGYELDMSTSGQNLRVLIVEKPNTIVSFFKVHWMMVVFLLLANILLPILLVYALNDSFTRRLHVLSLAFEEAEVDNLNEIEECDGKDEIGLLMHGYNRMVQRSKELIKTAYQDKLERQEIDLARQKAELHALHSQIDPHFLFNVLESIRMHSILKHETETAQMIEQLAILERQNVNWKKDTVTISEELQFIRAYLELQRYRFGERLKYEVTVAEGCENYQIPKLTLVTFVENACVHGVEQKSSTTWIYVRVYEQDQQLQMEVEDSGCGMSENMVQYLTDKMERCNMEDLTYEDHVGIINACLRMKMITDGQATFEIESEEGVGTFIMIRIPIDSLNR